jgi:hypothetical protein
MNMPIRNSLRKTLVLAGTLICSMAAQAQNCALCYTQAAASGSRLVQGLRSGILVLIFPPMMICIGFTVTAYRRRNRFHQQAVVATESDLGW